MSTRPASAAETTGGIGGVIVAPSGRGVAAAHVFATAPAGHYAVTSDAQGRFTIVAVTPDTYTLDVEAPGYRRYELRGITVTPGARASVRIALVTTGPQPIGRVSARRDAFSAHDSTATVMVAGVQARGPVQASASGLGNYQRGTIQAAVSTVPGVQQDAFGNIVLRGGRVGDVGFTYDAVPVPQALIAEPGGNVIGAQLATTGVGYVDVRTSGVAPTTDSALGGTVDAIPLAGTYPARTDVTVGVGVLGAGHDAEIARRWASPSLKQRYAVDASFGSDAIRYGDPNAFYPAEAGTFGLALSSRATWSLAANAHLALDRRDDLEILGVAGEATHDQYGTPFAGQTYGAFDGATTVYPGEPGRDAPVTTPTRIRGTYAIEKLELTRTYDRSYVRVRAYRSQYGATTAAPYFDDLAYPNGVISYAGMQSARLDGAGIDVRGAGDARHVLSYGVEVRRLSSALDQLVPTLDQQITANPVLLYHVGYASDDWTLSPALRVTGTLRYAWTGVRRSDGGAYGVAAVDPHVALVDALGPHLSFRVAFDHTTSPPKPLEAERHESGVPSGVAPPLAPERADVIEAGVEAGARVRARITAFDIRQHDRIDVLPAEFRSATAAGQAPGAAFGVPVNVGRLVSRGLDVALDAPAVSLAATYARAFSSSASQFALNDLNAAAIAAGRMFPVGYVPDLSVTAALRLHAGAVSLRPSLSWESGYPYGNGRRLWTYDANRHVVSVINDNHVNPGANYYFLRDPALPFDAVTNPAIASLGTPEGDDPNTMRTPPRLLAALHAEAPLAHRVTLALDVLNLFGSAAPTQLQSNPYLIGPPGYRGGNAAYAAWYGRPFGTAYLLGNGVPTNDGVSAAVPWTYGTQGYVPASYPEARTLRAELRLAL